jgi:hypothetical protein
MVYPVRIHVRYSTVLVIVLLLMGSVLYEVTRTESFGRQNAARTQDISLPAPQPVIHTVRGTAANFIGTSTFSRAAAQPLQPDRELIATAGYGSTAAVASSGRFESNAAGGGGGDFTGSFRNARAHSSGGSGYAPGSYGMGGVGAWGGVSGVMRPASTPAAAKPARVARVAEVKKASPAPKRGGSKSSGGGSGSSGVTATPGTAIVSDGTIALLAGGFTTGAAAVEPGAVVTVQPAAGDPQGPAPAPTPEPMSLMLVGTGLVALFGVRRHIQ